MASLPPTTDSLPKPTTHPPTSAPRQPLHPSTLALHADSHLNTTPDIAPPIHLSTTFSYARSPSDLIPATQQTNPHPADTHIYSRYTSPNSTRLETLLTPLLHGPALTYSSGLAALHALYVFLHPRRVSIGAGYHGSRGVLSLHEKLHALTVLPLECDAEQLEAGDVIHLETPVNPTGEARHMAAYAEKAHARGAYLVVDATFGPPGLQEPFMWGADMVVHSGTKYLGGHSDLLMGVLAVNPGREGEGWVVGLKRERCFLGSVMGGLEGWLGVRSLRTLEVRVGRQSRSAGELVGWLAGCLDGNQDGGGEGDGGEGHLVRKCVKEVRHASLQEGDMEWLKEQMPNGFGPVFAVLMREEWMARCLPSELGLFSHATSLGGVESLVEWRAMSDAACDTRLVRVSVGVEDWRDLRRDLVVGFGALVDGGRG